MRLASDQAKPGRRWLGQLKATGRRDKPGWAAASFGRWQAFRKSATAIAGFSKAQFLSGRPGGPDRSALRITQNRP